MSVHVSWKWPATVCHTASGVSSTTLPKQKKSAKVEPRTSGPMLLMSIIAVANISPARRPQAMPGMLVRDSPSVRPGSTSSAMPPTATATATMSIVWRRVCMAETGAHPTHDGAESLVSELCGALDEYSAGVARVYEAVWSEQEAKDAHHEMQNEPTFVER